MVEYGGGIANGPAGQVARGSGHQLGGSGDFFGSIGQAANNLVDTLASLPPLELLGLVVLVLAALMVLRRAF